MVIPPPDALPGGTIIAKTVNRQPDCTEQGCSAFLDCPDPTAVPPSVLVAIEPETLEVVDQVTLPEMMGGPVTTTTFRRHERELPPRRHRAVPVHLRGRSARRRSHVMTGASVLGSDGVPNRLDSFSYEGQIDVEAWNAAPTQEGVWDQGRIPPEPRRREFPLNLNIVSFGDRADRPRGGRTPRTPRPGSRPPG
jgi:hypothetical protein